ncbi:MAG: hypothetical protein LWY06_05675 [Firmicutes bacterium]|nr:hypothetical protein [Bacillota bacterium]
MDRINLPKISSEDFRANNRIFKEAKIVREYINELPTDTIDLNNNGVGDYTTKYKGFLGTHTSYETECVEPQFIQAPYDKIREFAKAHETEVITQDSIGDFGLSRLKYGGSMLYKITVDSCDLVGVTSLKELTKQEAPFTPDAKWAIDTKKRTVIFYEPKETKTSAEK